MGKWCLIIVVVALITFSLSCSFGRHNPLDEGGTDYIPPEIMINENASSLRNGDTTHFDTITIVLIGNHERSLFSLNIDASDWEENWEPAGVFGLGRLSDGKHILYIRSMYRGGELVVSDSMTFQVLTKGYKPEFEKRSDTTLTLFEGKSVILSIKTNGYAPMQYAWIKGKSVLEGKSSDSLQFASFSANDTASYKCIVVNQYGVDTSRVFTLKYRLFSGGVKGVVTDSSGNKLNNVAVTLSPSNMKDTTDSTGSFAFTSLQENSYALQIILLNYHDTVLSGVAVNDSETVVLPVIELIKIDTTTYRVAYNGNGCDGGTVPSDTVKYKPGGKIEVAAIGGLSRAGYAFTKWNTEKDGTGDDFFSGDSFTVTGNVILYAQWAVKQYALSFSGNNNTSGDVPEQKKYDYQNTITIPAKGTLERSGYSFSGWNTKADETGVTYFEGSNFTMPDSAVTLYAKWTTNPTYSIIYHGAAGTGGAVPATVNADSAMQIVIADSGSLYKTGYSFAGWNTMEDGSGKAYKSGDKVVMGSVNIDLYAQWTRAQFTITYHGNGNTGGTIPPVTTHLYQSEAFTPAIEPSRTGHNFTGWNTDSAGKGLDYKSGDKIVVEKDLSLYARWIKKRYLIVFSGNGERTSGIPPATEFEYGAKIDSSSFVPSRESYVFDGWYKDSLRVGKWIYVSDTVTSDDTLYAKWVIKDVDGNIYTEIKIGNQVWMVENLKVTKYNDGTDVTYITDPTQWNFHNLGSFCYFNSDTINKNKYGGLFDWYAVSTGNLAPDGWHVPSQDEIQTLLDFLIVNGFNYDGTNTGNMVARSLAINSSAWEISEVSGSPGYDITSANMRSGFNLLPGGYISGGDHFNNGEFRDKGTRAMLWTSTEYQGPGLVEKENAWYLDLSSTKASADLILNFKKAGRSVRCMRNY